eukprot:2798821-Rhodomonas_salina.1
MCIRDRSATCFPCRITDLSNAQRTANVATRPMPVMDSALRMCNADVSWGVTTSQQPTPPSFSPTASSSPPLPSGRFCRSVTKRVSLGSGNAVLFWNRIIQEMMQGKERGQGC